MANHRGWYIGSSLLCLKGCHLSRLSLSLSLPLTLTGLKGCTLLETALLLEMKQACSHRHAQSLMEMLWRGGSPEAEQMRAKGRPLPQPLPERYPYLRLVFHVLLPIHPPAGAPMHVNLCTCTYACARTHAHL